MSLLSIISVKNTTDLSIFIQIVTLIASLYGLSYNLPKKHRIINNLLIIETIVQIIELSFYLLFLRKLSNTVKNMAKTRYYDWIITTPVMHLTTIAYLDYLYRIENNLESLNIIDFIKMNIKNIKIIFLTNFLMLLSGYLYEIGIISKTKATIFGYIFFIILFSTIYNEYAKKTKFGKKIFYGLTLVWGTYGVGFIFNDNIKNNVFNILDLFAKNFFGIFLLFVAKKYSI